MLKKEDSIIDEKQVYLKPECEIYELYVESSILSSSDKGDINGADAEVNSFLQGRSYDTSVF